jgi:hypothetical protein
MLRRGGVASLAVLVTGLAAAAAAVGGTWAPPPAHAIFSYQIGGAFDPPPRASVIDRDRAATPAAGQYNICYINAFQAQPSELRWWRARHRRLLLARRGHPIVDRTWHEQLLDTSTAANRGALIRVVGRWIDQCAHAGYQAIEPDNLDSWDRSERALTRAGNLAFASRLIARAHADGLAIAQKNAAEVAPIGRRLGFDFAIAEECQPNAECDAYLRAYGARVIEIEYPDNGGARSFAAACRARGNRISVVYRDRDVTPAGHRGYLERNCD